MARFCNIFKLRLLCQLFFCKYYFPPCISLSIQKGIEKWIIFCPYVLLWKLDLQSHISYFLSCSSRCYYFPFFRIKRLGKYKLFSFPKTCNYSKYKCNYSWSCLGGRIWQWNYRLTYRIRSYELFCCWVWIISFNKKCKYFYKNCKFLFANVILYWIIFQKNFE